jgi:hypothetical protein
VAAESIELIQELYMAETVKKAKAPAKPRKSAAKTTAAPIELKPVIVSHEQIAKLAHQLWAERGYQHGSPEKDWLRAEQLLKQAS